MRGYLTFVHVLVVISVGLIVVIEGLLMPFLG